MRMRLHWGRCQRRELLLAQVVNKGPIASRGSQQGSQTHPRIQMTRIRAPAGRAVDEVLRVRRVRHVALLGVGDRGGGETEEEGTTLY